jgi:chromosome segregation ATPase
MVLFTKRDDVIDIRTARERVATAEAAFETAARMLRECRAAHGNYLDESATSRREHDVLEAERQRLREPGLATEVQKARIELLDARGALAPIEAARHAEGLAAILRAVTPDLEAIHAKLDDVRDDCRAALGRLAEMAARYDMQSTGYEQHFFIDWFIGDAHQESALEFRRRLARAEGLLG